MSKKHPEPFLLDPQRRIFLIARVVLLYIVMVVATIKIVLAYNFPLFKGDYYTFPTIWLWVIWALYYVAPFFFAILYGIWFRPFWQGFRNLLIAIVAVQLLYSFSVSMVRWDYLKKFEHRNRWSANDRLKIRSFKSQYLDKNQDGFKDELNMTAEFDLSKIRGGEYLIHATIVPGGGLSPLLIEGGGTIKIEKRADNNIFVQQFIVTPRTGQGVVYGNDFQFQIKIFLSRIINVDDQTTKLLQWTRWSPYFRETNWDGSDPEISGDWKVLESVLRPEFFILRVPPEEVKP